MSVVNEYLLFEKLLLKQVQPILKSQFCSSKENVLKTSDDTNDNICIKAVFA